MQIENSGGKCSEKPQNNCVTNHAEDKHLKKKKKISKVKVGESF